MSSVTSFLRQYLTDAELWLLLPLAGSVVMAVACFFVLNAAIDEKGSVSEAEKQELRQRIKEEGRKVVQRAEEKRQRDQQAIADRLKEQQRSAGQQEQSREEQQAAPTADTEQQAAEPAALTDAAIDDEKETQTSGASELRQRKGRTAAAAAARVEDGSSDADWEMVDNDELEHAAQPAFEMPAQLQQDVDASIAGIHTEPTAAEANTDIVHRAVLHLSSLLHSLMGSLSPAAAAEPDASSAVLSPSNRQSARSAILAQLVDKQTLHRLQSIADSNPADSALAHDASSLLTTLNSLLHDN